MNHYNLLKGHYAVLVMKFKDKIFKLKNFKVIEVIIQT